MVVKSAFLFINAFATTASCSASRSVVLTGTHNHRNGQFGHAHHYHKFTTFEGAANLSLPLALSREGYRTVHIGKYHVAPEKVYHFDSYLKANSRNPVEMANASEDIIAQKSDKPFFYTLQLATLTEAETLIKTTLEN